MILTLDFETRSVADLRAVSPWVYSEHPTTEVICACWALGDGLVQSWGNPAVGYTWGSDPDALLIAARDPEVLIEAHNTAFEFSVWHNLCVPRYGWPAVPVERWRDSMATACYYALPPDLATLCRVLGLSGKDPAGARLIQKYSKLNLKTALHEIAFEDLILWLRYCGQDVEQEREAGRLLGDLPEPEVAIFLHDFKVGLRGLALDRSGIVRARAVVDKRAEDLEREFAALTDGLSPGQRDKVLAWLAARGLELDNLQAETVEEALEEGLAAGDVKRALEVRREYARASVKKLEAMLRQSGHDGRARFQTRYHGAATGRNTGTGFQPLNLMRGYEDVDPEQLVRDVERGDPAWLDCVYGDAMEAVAKASRHWITASEGSRIIAGDFTSVEAVVLACGAGEEWKIEAFRNKELIYERMGERIHGLAPGTVTKKTHPSERQDGKTGELAFGYQGALGAWRKFDRSERHSDERVIEMCRAWRREHPMVVRFWRGLEDAAIEATYYPGRLTGYRDVGFERVDGWLTMILPNGKRIWYWAPLLRMAMPRWHEPEVNEDCADGTCRCQPRLQLSYESRKEGHWHRVPTYGGKLTENWDQATSRELLKPVELALEARGYPVVLSVYDEIVCDVPGGKGSVADYSEIVAETLASLEWAREWPIRMATPWEGRRYKK